MLKKLVISYHTQSKLNMSVCTIEGKMPTHETEGVKIYGIGDALISREEIKIVLESDRLRLVSLLIELKERRRPFIDLVNLDCDDVDDWNWDRSPIDGEVGKWLTNVKKTYSSESQFDKNVINIATEQIVTFKAFLKEIPLINSDLVTGKYKPGNDEPAALGCGSVIGEFQRIVNAESQRLRDAASQSIADTRSQRISISDPNEPITANDPITASEPFTLTQTKLNMSVCTIGTYDCCDRCAKICLEKDLIKAMKCLYQLGERRQELIGGDPEGDEEDDINDWNDDRLDFD